MNAIQLHILAGPIAGRRMTFAQAPISFGRDADNTLVLLDSTVSRHHGELRLEGERWVLVNHSPNGTRLNRRNVTDKPAAIGDQDTVYIGDQPVFQVTLLPESAAPATAGSGPAATGSAAGTGQPTGGPAAASGPVKVPLSRKASTWAYIGISFGVILLVLAFTADYFGKSSTGTPHPESVAELTDAQIANEISRPLPAPNSVDLERAKRALDKARTAVPRLTTETLFTAYRAFQEYLAYSGEDRLTGDDALHFREIQEKLINEVTRQYQTACALVSSPDRAHDEFRKVQRLYGDPSSEIYKNAEAHVTKANNELAAKKRGLLF